MDGGRSQGQGLLLHCECGPGKPLRPRSHKVDIPATAKLYNQCMIAGKAIIWWSCFSFGELLSTVK